MLFLQVEKFNTGFPNTNSWGVILEHTESKLHLFLIIREKPNHPPNNFQESNSKSTDMREVSWNSDIKMLESFPRRTRRQPPLAY